MNPEQLKEKYQAVRELSPEEQRKLFILMETFQLAAQETISGGEELLRMCSGCAYKKGTEASNTPTTALYALESVLKEEPFFCHKRFCPNGDHKLCNGWINIMNSK